MSTEWTEWFAVVAKAPSDFIVPRGRRIIDGKWHVQDLMWGTWQSLQHQIKDQIIANGEGLFVVESEQAAKSAVTRLKKLGMKADYTPVTNLLLEV